MKPMLKAPGIKRLRLKYDESPSKFAFKFNLRRYTKGEPADSCTFEVRLPGEAQYQVGWCKLEQVETCVESAWFQRLKLKTG